MAAGGHCGFIEDIVREVDSRDGGEIIDFGPAIRKASLSCDPSTLRLLLKKYATGVHDDRVLNEALFNTSFARSGLFAEKNFGILVAAGANMRSTACKLTSIDIIRLENAGLQWAKQWVARERPRC
ncbi:MAG: hypothetical protein AAAFM81_05760 [Pseudomonadota bacterium]